MPRTDLHVTVAGTEVKPCLALGAWAAFHHLSANDSTVIDDLVLTDDEVAPVMKALQQGGAEVTALHNHLVGESPKMITPPSLGAGTAINFQPTGGHARRSPGISR